MLGDVTTKRDGKHIISVRSISNRFMIFKFDIDCSRKFHFSLSPSLEPSFHLLPFFLSHSIPLFLYLAPFSISKMNVYLNSFHDAVQPFEMALCIQTIDADGDADVEWNDGGELAILVTGG